ncbi:uncharacterized protein DUF935 [Microcella alkaliphila]|uniref:Uncharacterized protein DUF935 n=1 Tax=Microcella alkaliphila TaxID=279828 RepID=A0A4Q7TFR3_9MICO|nr:DUF935 family protein [Microcella alkaliphila]RZT59326.1 uncharacterized protein DUF935 [Microcella alkaliphila]
MPETGYQAAPNLLSWGTLIAETHEPNPDLQWPKSIDVFDRMRREDPQVKSVLRAVTLPIMRTEWVIDGAGCRDEVVAHIAADFGLPIKGQAFEAPVRSKGRFSFKEHLRLALLELPYGHSFFEQVYSQADGRAHLAKLAWRPPRTISDIEVAQDGGLVAIKQHAIAGGTKEPRIPVDRLVAYVNEREGANWLGESLLRSAYKMWLLKDRVLRIQALVAERNGLGIPVYEAAELPDGIESAERDAWLKSEKDAGLALAKSMRAGEAAGASIPNSAKLSLIGVTGKLPDTDKPIRYYDEQIARAVLAHFLNLGTETGSWALGSTFANFFTDSLNAVAQHIAEVTQRHVIEDLVDLNWGPNEPAPRLVPSPIGEQQAATAEAIKSLIDCGALSKDPALEQFLRAKYGLPVKEESDAAGTPAAEAERARAAAETAQKVYLATDKPPLRQEEARELIKLAGANLTGDGPDTRRIPNHDSEESA